MGICGDDCEVNQSESLRTIIINCLAYTGIPFQGAQLLAGVMIFYGLKVVALEMLKLSLQAFRRRWAYLLSLQNCRSHGLGAQRPLTCAVATLSPQQKSPNLIGCDVSLHRARVASRGLEVVGSKGYIQ